MKVPVYLESTLELIAVVEAEGVYLDALKSQRFVKVAYTGRVRTGPYPGDIDAAAFELQDATFTRVTYRNAYAETFAMTVTKREHATLWPRRVWPRQKKKDRYKPSRAERKDRRQYMEQHPQAMTRDQVNDPLYRKLVRNT